VDEDLVDDDLRVPDRHRATVAGRLAICALRSSRA
jgi:hypothetical protein